MSRPETAHSIRSRAGALEGRATAAMEATAISLFRMQQLERAGARRRPRSEHGPRSSPLAGRKWRRGTTARDRVARFRDRPQFPCGDRLDGDVAQGGGLDRARCDGQPGRASGQATQQPVIGSTAHDMNGRDWPFDSRRELVDHRRIAQGEALEDHANDGWDVVRDRLTRFGTEGAHLCRYVARPQEPFVVGIYEGSEGGRLLGHRGETSHRSGHRPQAIARVYSPGPATGRRRSGSGGSFPPRRPRW